MGYSPGGYKEPDRAERLNKQILAARVIEITLTLPRDKKNY